MNIINYPQQERLSEFGEKHYRVMARRSSQLLATERAYGSSSVLQQLLFYKAQSEREEKAPLLVFFHGGGWTNGYKEYASFMGPLFAMSGISFATVGYRLAPEHLFPSGWDDCCAALAWCHNNSSELNVARNQVYVGGFSAGAHYASLLATRNDWQDLHGLPSNFIKGCLPISGSYYFGPDAGFAIRPRFLGTHELSASPLHHVSEQTPGFHLSWGEWDFPHLITQARNFAERLRQHSVDVITLELPERDHLGAGLAAGEIQGPWYASARAWIQQQSKKGDASENNAP